MHNQQRNMVSKCRHVRQMHSADVQRQGSNVTIRASRISNIGKCLRESASAAGLSAVHRHMLQYNAMTQLARHHMHFSVLIDDA